MATRQARRRRSRAEPTEAVHNELGAHATGPVIQAGTINGDIRLHATPPAPRPRQLPPAPTWFTGRGKELLELNTAWCAVREFPIITIVGTGGIGKTSLALRWAHSNVDLFPDGQLYVDLRGQGAVEQPAAAVRVLLDALGADHRSMPTDFDALVGRYRSLVADRRMLIVFDNARDTAQVAALLPGTRTCAVLVTSRDRMEGLHSSFGAVRVALEELSTREAHELLVQRLGDGRVEADREALRELLDYCAGLPLALAVVAGRLATHTDFPLTVVAAELKEATTRLSALDTGDPSTTLTSLLSLSYKALSPDTAELFGFIGLIPTPDVGLGAARALTGLDTTAVRALMRELERASLVGEHLPGRWRMHDLIHLYAAQQARAHQSPELQHAALRRLADYYLHSAYTGDRMLDGNRVPIALDEPATGSRPEAFDDRDSALAWFIAEHRCTVGVQQVAAERGWHSTVWQLTWSLHTYRWRRGHFHDQVAGWSAAVSAAQSIGDTAAVATAHRLLGAACTRIGDLERSFEHLNHALELLDQAGDPVERAHAHRALARARERGGEHQQALAQALQARTLYREADSPGNEADALDLMCLYETKLGRYEEAREHCAAALALYRQRHDREGEATTLDSLGYLAQRTGRYRDALAHYEQAILLFDGTNPYHQANTLERLGEVHAELADPVEARLAWRRALELLDSGVREADAARVRDRLDALPQGVDTETPRGSQ
ncbi:tetratricopeptide repeat protein [Kutzneria albida]|uniref:SARP family transcription regulator n=1 Tax=Kutzneria albida DSM 43870 TaxID=1449976 RepID=W5W277_9PSEU|nr:tetratricopeptide repeat protein [Kutzneria albida]AHH95263.1 SARP family transcription regulator [Kutzneria albida DSM 43870]